MVNEKTYIGVHSTYNLNDGYIGCGVKSQAHAKSYKKSKNKSAFIDSVLKYGYSNFSREILDFFDSTEDAYNEEKFIVDSIWVKSKSNYNIAFGGLGGGKHTKKTTEEQDEYIFSDFMSGMLKEDISKKHNISLSVIYRIIKERDTSNRKRGKTKAQIRVDDWVFKNKESIIESFTNGESKDSINKRIPIDLYKSNILNGIEKKHKYIVLINGEPKPFSSAKSASKLTGVKIYLSGVYSCIKHKGSYKGFVFYNKNEWDSGVRYKEKMPTKTTHHGKKLYKNKKEYCIAYNLNEFCRENNLPEGSLCKLFSGKVDIYYGFKLKL